MAPKKQAPWLRPKPSKKEDYDDDDHDDDGKYGGRDADRDDKESRKRKLMEAVLDYLKHAKPATRSLWV